MSEWQPIETAPKSTRKDGGDWSEVLVWNTEYERCDLARIASDGSPMWGDWNFEIKASHWMPLPEPPEQETLTLSTLTATRERAFASVQAARASGDTQRLRRALERARRATEALMRAELDL